MLSTAFPELVACIDGASTRSMLTPWRRMRTFCSTDARRG